MNVEIGANEWSTANPRHQIELMVNALKDAVIGTRATRLSDEDKAIIIARLDTGFENSVRYHKSSYLADVCFPPIADIQPFRPLIADIAVSGLTLSLTACDSP